MGAYTEYLEFARSLATRASALVAESFLGTFQVDYKGITNLVTDVDRRSEGLLVGALSKEYPHHAITAEEGSGREAAGGYRWHVDPLDGTNNFAHGYPMVAVTLALEHEGRIVAGVTRDCLAGESWWAEVGAGAFCERGTVRVSAAPRLSAALLSTGFPYDKHASPQDNLGNFARVTKRVQGIRRGGSAAIDLAYVAAGRLDGFWELKLSSWDTAAGILLVAEAGGRVSRIDGSPYRPGDLDLVATNGVLHDELSSLLRLEG